MFFKFPGQLAVQRHSKDLLRVTFTACVCLTLALPTYAQSVPPGTGTPWPGRTITVSFPIDGTPVGRSQNQFADRLSNLDEKQRRSEILRALQAWSQVANIDFALVRDGQSPLGTVGLAQGDPRFGDIRIVAVPLDQALANAVPFSPFGGSWAGDILLNSDIRFVIQQPAPTSVRSLLSPVTWVKHLDSATQDTQTSLAAAYEELSPSASSSQPTANFSEVDLWTVLVHEAGNALGLPDNNSPTSVMYLTYSGPRTGLSAGDISAIQQLYGPRPADRYETPAGSNNTRKKATPIAASNVPIQTIEGELAGKNDVDWYRYVPRAGESRAVFRLKAVGKSLLLGSLSGYDSAGKELFKLETEDHHERQDLAVDLGSYAPRRPLFLRVSMTSKLPAGHAFGTGRYQVEIDRRPEATATVEPSPFEPIDDDDDFAHSSAVDLEELLAANPGLLNEAVPNETLATPTVLPSTPGFPTDSRFEVLAALNSATDRDVYRWSNTPGANRRFVITFDTVGENDSDFVFGAFDDQGALIPAEISRGVTSGYLIELGEVPNSTTISLAVGVENASTTTNIPYTVVVNRVRPNVPADGLQAGTLTEAERYFGANWSTTAPQLFRLDLTADVVQGKPEDGGVQAVLFDSRGEMAVNLAIRAGGEAHQYALIQPDDFEVRILGLTPNVETLLPEIQYRLTWVAISDDIGPLPSNPSYPNQYNNPNNRLPPPLFTPVPSIPVSPVVPVAPPAANPWLNNKIYSYYNFISFPPR